MFIHKNNKVIKVKNNFNIFKLSAVSPDFSPKDFTVVPFVVNYIVYLYVDLF